MKLDRVNAWLSLAASVAVLVGIVFLAVEINQNTAMMETQIHQSRAAQAMAEAQSLYNSDYVPALLVKVKLGEELSNEERVRYTSLFRAFNRNWDNQLRQFNQGFLAANIPRSLRGAILEEIGSSELARMEWERTKDTYSDEYIEFVDSVLLRPTPSGAVPLWDNVGTHHRTFFPTGEGPFPMVVAVPGCSGVSLDGPASDAGRLGDEADRLFRRHYARMAERLRDAGFGVVLVDYLTAEGVPNTCSGEISHERVGEYVAASLEFAQALPSVDLSRIYIVGWSHGGAGVIAWLQALGEGNPPVAGAVAIYPGCSGRDAWVSTVPVLVLLGEADDITPPESCDAILRGLPDGAHVQVRRYAGARHGFDFTEGPEVLPIGGGMTVGRNPAAGEQAWEEIFAFLGRQRSD